MSQTDNEGTGARGEANRLLGNYSEAIENFTEALGKPDLTDKQRTWLLAHRGAAYGAIGAIKLATEDLEPALSSRNGRYAWAQAQLAEANRLYVLMYMPTLDRNSLWSYLADSYLHFNEALALQPKNPWIWAHQGAMFANAYWASRRLPPLDVEVDCDGPGSPHAGAAGETRRRFIVLPTEHLRECAEAAFKKAIELSPGYSWAYAFHAFMRVLADDFPEAKRLLGVAQAYDVNQRLSPTMLRNLAKLLSYEHCFGESVNAGWLALQKNPFDLISAYFVAVGLHKQEKPTAQLAIDQAERLLATAEKGIAYMKVSLRLLRGDISDPEKEIGPILKSGDIEVRSIFFHDPVWKNDAEDLWQKIFKP